MCLEFPLGGQVSFQPLGDVVLTVTSSPPSSEASDVGLCTMGVFASQ